MAAKRLNVQGSAELILATRSSSLVTSLTPPRLTLAIDAEPHRVGRGRHPRPRKGAWAQARRVLAVARVSKPGESPKGERAETQGP